MKMCLNCEYLIADGWGDEPKWRCAMRREVTEDKTTPNTCPDWMYEPGTDSEEIGFEYE